MLYNIKVFLYNLAANSQETLMYDTQLYVLYIHINAFNYLYF